MKAHTENAEVGHLKNFLTTGNQTKKFDHQGQLSGRALDYNISQTIIHMDLIILHFSNYEIWKPRVSMAYSAYE